MQVPSSCTTGTFSAPALLSSLLLEVPVFRQNDHTVAAQTVVPVVQNCWSC